MSENKYGHLLDKYMDDARVDCRTKQEREQAARDKYGNLLDQAKPNNKIYDDILNVDRMCKEIVQKRADEYEQKNRERQERIERERTDHQNRLERNNAFVNDFLKKKEAEQKVAEQKKKKVCK